MDARYVQSGDSIDFRPDRDVAAGELVVVGRLVGVSKLDVKAGELGSIALEGLFDMRKLPNWSFIGCGVVGWSADRNGVCGWTVPDAVPIGHNVKPNVRSSEETIPVRLCQGAKFS
jgi:predicted RecA/RadA family phage recombinase